MWLAVVAGARAAPVASMVGAVAGAVVEAVRWVAPGVGMATTGAEQVDQSERATGLEAAMEATQAA